jgi:hypothetical protein
LRVVDAHKLNASAAAKQPLVGLRKSSVARSVRNHEDLEKREEWH